MSSLLQITVRGAEQLGLKLAAASRQVPNRILQAVQKACYLVQAQAKRNVTGGHPLHRKTSRLGASITTQVNQLGHAYEGRVGTNVIYGPVHEFGMIIVSKGQKMHFPIGTGRGQKWITKDRVGIPARPWLSPALEVNQGRIVAMLDESIALTLQENRL